MFYVNENLILNSSESCRKGGMSIIYYGGWSLDLDVARTEILWIEMNWIIVGWCGENLHFQPSVMSMLQSLTSRAQLI